MNCQIFLIHVNIIVAIPARGGSKRSPSLGGMVSCFPRDGRGLDRYYSFTRGIGMDKGNILVVDDSPLVLEVISKYLRDKGFNTLTACDGIEAIEKTFTELPDLIILDVAMPKMNGYQVCRLLKSDPETCHIPIIILTVKDQAHDKYWGIQTGADAYLSQGT